MMKIFSVILGVVSFFYSSFALSEELSLIVDKKVLSEGDVLSLSIVYSGDENGKPDLSALQDDFQIVSNSTSSQMNYINGVFSQSKKWTVGLKPLKSGKIVIKPISFGGLTSNYEEVEVKELTNEAYIPDSKNNFNSPTFKIMQDFESSRAYLHQQLNMVITIYDSLGLKDGTIKLNEEAKQDWIVRQLTSEPIVSHEVIDGKKMNVIKIWYALFPQKSGKLEAPEFSFDGFYFKDANFGFKSLQDDFMMFGVDFRNSFGQKVPVLMKTEKKFIEVLPNPEGVLLKDWLPLKDLRLSSSLSAKNGFKVGEAFSQMVEVMAVGTEKSLFYGIDISESSSSLKQYPEKPEITEELVNGNIVVKARYNIVYIPQDAGEFDIPEIKVKWFNLNTNKEDVSIVRSEKIIVYPSNGNMVEPKVLEKNIDKESAEKTISTTDNNKETTIKKEKKSTKKEFRFGDLGIFTGLFVIFVIGLFMKRKKSSNNQKYYKKMVINSIEKHDYRLAKSSIIEW
ncbi:MAG: BatD family protein, partial [Alphaproteobacteria bacterium]|nr:BatD family protein [Alphaproteobacteria bacterium]